MLVQVYSHSSSHFAFDLAAVRINLDWVLCLFFCLRYSHPLRRMGHAVQLDIPKQIFHKYSNQNLIKFVQRERNFSMRTDGRTDMMKQTVTFRSFFELAVSGSPPLSFTLHVSADLSLSDNPTLSRLTSHCCY